MPSGAAGDLSSLDPLNPQTLLAIQFDAETNKEVAVKKDILTLKDLTRQDMIDLFDLAAELKSRQQQGIVDTFLKGKVLGLIFDKHSTRTRVSFEAAMNQLGGSVIYMSSGDMQIARDEPVKLYRFEVKRYK